MAESQASRERGYHYLDGFLQHRHPSGSGPLSAVPQALPRSGSGPASPGSFKLTSDRYRGKGETERLPSTSERNTEISEEWRSTREADGKYRKIPEMPEVNRPSKDRCRKLSRVTGNYRISLYS
ncbi:hypothetical protein H920_10947 [Fukomys damarensis]|uniref:Uncharacterized protein n=1 Tax=Fukomys damarensis TaxID=885580 RepID=A0A091DBR4_FUKDA|nr:hypothetical protein H920_10947 [Fukomys damarensis]